jgi:hypothetical protein
MARTTTSRTMQRQIMHGAGSAALGSASCPRSGLLQHCDAPPSGLGHEKAHAVILVSWSFAFRKGSRLEQNASLQRHFGQGTTGRVGYSVVHSKHRLKSPYHRRAGEVKRRRYQEMSADFVDETASAQSRSLDTAPTLWPNTNECRRQCTSRPRLFPLPS